MAAYGSPAYYPHILRANPNLSPTGLKIGMVINLPPLAEVKASHAAEKAGAEKAGAEKPGDVPAGPRMVEDVKIDPSRQYRIVAGDSLYKIGQKLYGTGTMGEKIYDINKATIGPDPKRLKLGMVLVLPEPPSAGSAPAERAPAMGAPVTPTAKGSGPAEEKATSGSGSLEEAWNNGTSASEPLLGNESDPK
jgi:LysM repeat protein